MKFLRRTYLLTVLTGLSLVSCSENKFNLSQSSSCLNTQEQFGDGSCAITTDGYTSYSYTLKTGTVDILFVVDNSYSMYAEQSKMADRFPAFIDSISNLDYQIAITTTDISGPKNGPKSHNKQGALQDGKFIKFGTNKDYLSKASDSSKTIKSEFIKTIKRAETLDCRDAKDRQKFCPSWDERGIAALNLAFKRGHSKFFRKDSHLAVVILSDEDERSHGGTSSLPLKDIDLPTNLLGEMANSFGSKKVMSVHSVIVKPGDRSCLRQQKAQDKLSPGAYGVRYSDLSNACERGALNDNNCKSLLDTGQIIPGVTGNICSNDYGRELGNIAEHIKAIDFIQLPCEPLEDSLSVLYESTQTPLSYTLEGTRVTFTNPVQAGITIRPSFKCSL